MCYMDFMIYIFLDVAAHFFVLVRFVIHPYSFEIFPGQTWSSDGGFKFRDVSQRSGSRVDNPDEVIGVQIVEIEAIIMNVAAIKLSGYPKNIRIIRF